MSDMAGLLINSRYRSSLEEYRMRREDAYFSEGSSNSMSGDVGIVIDFFPETGPTRLGESRTTLPVLRGHKSIAIG